MSLCINRRNLPQKWLAFPSTVWHLNSKKWNLLPLFGNQLLKSGIFCHFLELRCHKVAGSSQPFWSKISPNDSQVLSFLVQKKNRYTSIYCWGEEKSIGACTHASSRDPIPRMAFHKKKSSRGNLRNFSLFPWKKKRERMRKGNNLVRGFGGCARIGRERERRKPSCLETIHGNCCSAALVCRKKGRAEKTFFFSSLSHTFLIPCFLRNALRCTQGATFLIKVMQVQGESLANFLERWMNFLIPRRIEMVQYTNLSRWLRVKMPRH